MLNFKKRSNVGYYLQPVLQLSSNQVGFAVKKGRMRRTNVANGHKCVDEDLTPSDMTIDYKVISFLHLHSDFWYNSLGSTCTCHYLILGTNVSQSASPSKLNFQITGSPTILHWEGHNSFIRSEFEFH